jgi:hypothetical protein
MAVKHCCSRRRALAIRRLQQLGAGLPTLLAWIGLAHHGDSPALAPQTGSGGLPAWSVAVGVRFSA